MTYDLFFNRYLHDHPAIDRQNLA
ncbi:uncharacterized protein METZ01_LOCUS311475, partial [marine metagenome]